MRSAVEEILAREFGGFCAVEEATIALTAVVGSILKNDPERVAWLLVNTGAVDAQVSFELSAGGVDAIPITANGGNLSVTVREDFILPTYSLLGRGNGGATTLRTIIVRRVST